MRTLYALPLVVASLAFSASAAEEPPGYVSSGLARTTAVRNGAG